MQILLIITILIYVLTVLYYWRHSKKIWKQYIENKKDEIEKEISERVAYRDGLECAIESQEKNVKLLEDCLREGERQKEQLFKQLEDYEKQQMEYINHHVEIIKEIKTNETLNQLERERKQAEAEFECIKKEKQNEIDALSAQIESFRLKQDAINQEILRRRELEEKADFYRVCLSDEAIGDITELQIVRQKLKKPEILDKIIYDTYVAKPVLEMVKRVLQNSTCSGIYKITCQETKEIYIGKSTDIKNRWQQHCKTAFNCGTIASSLLHRKMQQYGIENFTFELLEVVPKDKLSEREKFYIDFYKTKETGMNERNG